LIDPRLRRRSPAVTRFLVLCGVLGLATAALIIAQAVALGTAIDAVFLERDDLGRIGLLLLVLVGVALGRGAVSWLLEAAGHRTALTTIRALRRDLVDAALRRRPGATATSSADTATAALRGIDGLDPYFARFLPSLVLAAVVPLAIIAFVATLDLLSAAIMLATAPLIPLFGVLVGSATGARARARYAALGRLSGHFLDVVRGLTTLRVFNRGPAQVTALRESGEAYRLETYRTLRLAFLSSLVLELAASLSIAVIAVEIGVRLVAGTMAFLPALIILVLAPELYQPLRNAAAQFHASADGTAALDRILGPIEEAENAPPPGSAPAPDPGLVPIVLDRVGFVYGDRATRVLDDFSLRIEPGERVALVGPSGAGKSTVARLLLLFEEPDAGAILIGDQPLVDIDPEAWRARIGWVPQHPVLTRGTLADAIRLGRPDADAATLGAAVERSALADVVAELPDGLETVIGDGGRRLSAGQTRRVALARALVREPGLLVLDEPTASLDTDSATAIGRALEALPRAGSVLLITHDPALAARVADRVITVAPIVAAEAVPR
jgi:ATP-binding cassette subfamily C protein CydCD